MVTRPDRSEWAPKLPGSSARRDAWFKNKVFATEKREDHQRHKRFFVVPGPWEPEEEPAVDGEAAEEEADAGGKKKKKPKKGAGGKDADDE